MKRLILSVSAVFFLSLFASNAFAQGKFEQGKDILEQAEGFYKGSCGQALKGAFKKGRAEAKAAKGACKAFSNCKKSCRSSKKNAKKACKGKKGKAKRKCKKAARKGKRNCVKDCRKQAKTAACKKARMALIKGLVNSGKALAKNPQCREFAKKAAAAIKAAGQ